MGPQAIWWLWPLDDVIVGMIDIVGNSLVHMHQTRVDTHSYGEVVVCGDFGFERVARLNVEDNFQYEEWAMMGKEKGKSA